MITCRLLSPAKAWKMHEYDRFRPFNLISSRRCVAAASLGSSVCRHIHLYYERMCSAYDDSFGECQWTDWMSRTDRNPSEEKHTQMVRLTSALLCFYQQFTPKCKSTNLHGLQQKCLWKALHILAIPKQSICVPATVAFSFCQNESMDTSSVLRTPKWKTVLKLCLLEGKGAGLRICYGTSHQGAMMLFRRHLLRFFIVSFVI